MGNGDSAHVVNGVQTDYKKVFYSDYEDALILPVTVQAGYGTLKAGTVMAENLSAAGNDGKVLPYNPTTYTGAEVHPGRAYLVGNLASGETSGEVTIDDSYKFAVGDDIIINSSEVAAANGGAIVSIDRTTYTNRAVIAFTTAITNGAPIADDAYACVEAGDNSNGYSDAVGILAQTVETGTGVNSKGGNAGLIISNAILYEGMLTNLDAAAKTDLVTSSRGQYLIMK